jgi:ATP-binding cassette subfamily B protein
MKFSNLMKNYYFSLIKTVWCYGKPWRYSIIGYYLALTVTQVFLSLSPYAFGKVIDELQNFRHGKLPQVIFWLIIGIAVLLLFWLFHGPARVTERNIALKIWQAFRLSFYEKLIKLPLKWHQNHHFEVNIRLTPFLTFKNIHKSMSY